jgi:hypothetical protein
MYTILEYVGKTLSIFIFKDLHSNPDLRLAPATLPTPIPLAGNHVDGVEIAVLERAAECESNLLVWILERAMAFTRQRDESATITSNIPPTPSQSSPAAGLSERARNKLQNSLLKGVFGADDPEFQDSLQPPGERPESQIDDESAGWLRASPEKDIGQWFSQEVWRLLGWDVLLRGKGF